ncbi:leucine--tRNA ligase [Candidatus Woesebacteria bacterium]|nr:leucine--tRNA ligase [Candidatus Woesebacteria bacterium]
MYDHKQIEEKWLAFWEEKQLFQDSAHFDANRGKEMVKSRVDEPFSEAEKLYLLFAFAYPSGAGLHVGHVESSTALDILARYYRMNGKQVFLPVGWDAFGLPAENYAVKTGVPPAVTTKNAITTFRRQVKRVGISYDWANEIATSHPGYYRWTQWLFLQLFNKGMAYQGTGMVNWCSSCQTVLANEQVVDGTCERCGTQVMQKDMKQWFFKITKYRDELISGLDQVDWPHATKQQQLNWIGRSEGINITYKVVGSAETITCFTTTPVNFGATFLVIAPENKTVERITTAEHRQAVDEYVKRVAERSELERTINKEKTGMFTGAYVENHVTGGQIPVYVADFVLAHVGTGAVQGCPAHDERDFEFAKKFGIPIKRVVVGDDGDTSPVERKEQLVVKGMNGKMINSDFLDGIEFKDAMHKTMDYFEEKGWGERVTSYKLRDWLISRQRYWGAPIPVVYDPEGEPHPVKEEHLPWLLPTDVDFKPTGESPLRSSKEFIERTERLYGKGWRPEFDTMDTFVDSSWYYLRYVSSRNEEAFSDAKQLTDWLPVDFYMIGPEHIVLHLLYSRFFTKFLRDEGHLNFSEPFQKMRHQGMILGPDGKKMSKSKGNVINPDEIIEKFGADCLRMYEMFMGPIESDKPWNVTAVMGVYRFLQRLESTISAELSVVGQVMSAEDDIQARVRQKLHNTLKKVTLDIPASKFNTAIASLMELLNDWEAARRQVGEKSILTQEELSLVVRMIAPFAPFLAEELWQQLPEDLCASQRRVGEELSSVHLTVWPVFDAELAKPANVIIPVQINGKVRAKLQVVQELLIEHAVILEQALSHPDVLKHIEGKKIKKQLYIAGKIVSIVIE